MPIGLARQATTLTILGGGMQSQQTEIGDRWQGQTVLADTTISDLE